MKIVYLGNLANVAEALGRRRDVCLASWLVEEEDAADPRILEAVRSIGVPLRAVKTSGDVERVLTSLGPLDLGILANFGLILKAEALRRPRLGFVNAHLGILPDYPGRHPIRNALERGERVVGATLHRAVERADAGEILDQRILSAGPIRRGEAVMDRITGLLPGMIGSYLERTAAAAS